MFIQKHREILTIRTTAGVRDSARRYENRFRSHPATDTRASSCCTMHPFKKIRPAYVSLTNLQDGLLPISRSVFDIDWKVEIVGNVGSREGY